MICPYYTPRIERLQPLVLRAKRRAARRMRESRRAYSRLCGLPMGSPEEAVIAAQAHYSQCARRCSDASRLYERLRCSWEYAVDQEQRADYFS